MLKIVRSKGRRREVSARIAEGERLRTKMGAARVRYGRAAGDSFWLRTVARVPFTDAWYVQRLRDLKWSMERHLRAQS